MIQAYNFIGSWQLFPEKGKYEQGNRPKSSIYKIETTEERKTLAIHHSWVSLENEAFSSQYRIIADGDRHPFENENFADEARVQFKDALVFSIEFFQRDRLVLEVIHELLPNGYLCLNQKKYTDDGSALINSEFFHKQLSVLPYSAAVSGAVVRPNEEGVIRHKALHAMEEQTNMQLDQIRKQVELLALQAQEIHQRKELSLKIFNAKLSFKPEVGQVYHLYEKQDHTNIISMISPKEWGASMPFKKHVATVQLLADQTWKEL